jgi:hypothetical protein
MIAGQAADFATQFNLAFASGLEGPVPFRVELMTPAGPSTAGGKQALQHIRLVPTGKAETGTAIVIGSVNLKDFSAEIRTYGMLADNYASRFKGASPPIDTEKYAALVKQMKMFLSAQSFTVTMLAVSASIQPPPMSAPPARSPGWVIGVVLALVALLGAGGYLLLRGMH